VVGPGLKIFNIFAEYPGSSHDSFIWRNSAVRDGLAAGNFPEGWLIGDSGYPQEPWLHCFVLEGPCLSSFAPRVHSLLFFFLEAFPRMVPRMFGCCGNPKSLANPGEATGLFITIKKKNMYQ
jgi:hypothetical protein